MRRNKLPCYDLTSSDLEFCRLLARLLSITEDDPSRMLFLCILHSVDWLDALKLLTNLTLLSLCY